jgi:HprK-related kinase A
MLSALPRPVSLKNESIAIIRARHPDAILGPEAHDTAKGTVAHLKTPADAVARSDVPAQPTHIVFPRYDAAVSTSLEPIGKAHALLELAKGSFNYSVLGLRGFEASARLVDGCACHFLEFSQLDDAIDALEALHASSSA